jgi:cytochrome c biogenesis protein CcdA
MLLMFHWMHSRSVSPTLRRFAWGVSSGSITGLQNFLKDSSTLLKAERPPGQGLPWYLPLFAILAIVSAFSGLLLLTACMKRYDATYSSAMFVGSFVVSASIMSACHYSTFQHLETLWNQILYPAGLLILMGGVLLLVKEKKESPEGDNDDDSEEDDITGISTPEERSESETKTMRHELVRTSKVMPTVFNFVSDDIVSCTPMHIHAFSLVFRFAMCFLALGTLAIIVFAACAEYVISLRTWCSGYKSVARVPIMASHICLSKAKLWHGSICICVAVHILMVNVLFFHS